MDQQLVTAYERLLEECRRRGEVLAEPPAGKDQRAHPRLRVTPARMAVPLTPWRLALDVSASGMAFVVDRLPTQGNPVHIALGEEAAADVDVLACDEIPLQALDDPPRYRVRCRFTDEEQGLRLLVAIKATEGIRAGAA